MVKMDGSAPAQANPQGLMPIGAVAAHNIAAILNLSTEHVGTIEQAIKDEINAMSSHFTLAIADVQTQYEVEVAKIKSDFNWINANQGKVALFGGVILIAGFVSGLMTGIFA